MKKLEEIKEKTKDAHEKSCNNNEIMNPIYHFHPTFGFIFD